MQFTVWFVTVGCCGLLVLHWTWEDWKRWGKRRRKGRGRAVTAQSCLHAAMKESTAEQEPSLHDVSSAAVSEPINVQKLTSHHLSLSLSLSLCLSVCHSTFPLPPSLMHTTPPTMVLTSCSMLWSNMGVYWNIGPSQLTSIALIDETVAFGEPLVPGLVCGPASWLSSSDSACSMKLIRPVWPNTWTGRHHITSNKDKNTTATHLGSPIEQHNMIIQFEIKMVATIKKLN